MEIISNILNAKCSSCGSELIYNPKKNCLTCKYCETNVYLPKKNEHAVLVRQYTSDFHPNQLNQALRAYQCSTCGTTYYISSEESSKKCPNCGNVSSSIIEDPGYCADGIIPFKITKEDAKTEFLKYLKRNNRIPSDIKNCAKEAEFEGVFIPVWNFQFNVDSVYSANVTELKYYSDGTCYSTSKPIYGEKHKRIRSLDQSATSTETDDFLQLFDENDYNGIIPYTPEYTYGFKVDTINRNIHDYYYTVTKSAEDETKDEIKKKLLSSYKEISNISVDSRANDVFFNFTYIPVYIQTYKKNDKTYKTYVSGTTGKVIGHKPKTPANIIWNISKLLILAALVYLIIKIINS